ncbi:MAG: M48 family metallopeptidase [Gemmatimonadetes bacterium]|nr:M48 family metallopeptidase [Gemmatimonadota bacterium]
MDENGNQNDEGRDEGGDLTSPGPGGFQRRILTEISPQAWEHPADRAALNALRKIPGFDLALRKIFGMFGERAIRLAFKANAVRVSEKQYPWIHERTLRVCEIMDLKEIPEVYVSQTPLVNAGAVGMSDPFIVLNSSMLEVLDHDEVEAVLAHEVGHILSGHVLYRTLLLLIMRLAMFRYPIAGLALLPILWALLEWYRKSELSCDRAALIAVQDKEIVMSSLMKLAGGTRGETLDLQEFIAQSEEYREGGDLLDSVYKVLNVIGATHPFSVVRVAELRDWIDTGTYDKIMTGDYVRRSDEDLKPYREDLAEAAKGYTDAAQEIFDEVDAAVDKLKTRFTDAWRRGKSD